jgi:hypothetical protein
MYNTNEKVQAFLQTGISREVMVICQEDEEFYRLGWKEDNITKSERVHISNIAKMPLPFKKKHASKKKIFIIGLLSIFFISELMIILVKVI